MSMEQHISLWQQDSILQQFVHHDANVEYVMISIFDVLLLSQIKNKFSFHRKVYDHIEEQGIFNTNVDRQLYVKLRTEIARQAFHKLMKNPFKKQDELEDFPLFLMDKSELLAVEYNMLLQNIYANPIIIDFMRYLKMSDKKIILIDYCFYDKSQIKQMLEAAEVTSSLYDEIVLLNGLTHNWTENFVGDSKIVHIKNEKEYDAIYGKSHDVDTISYDIFEKSLLNSVDMEELFYEDADESFYMLRKVLQQQHQVKTNPYFEIGCLHIGPLLSAFIYNTYHDVKKEKRKVILPLMREGELLSEMFQVLLKITDDAVTTVKPLYVSRKATYLPTVSKQNVRDIISFFESIHIPVKSLLVLLEMELDNALISYAENNLYQLKTNNVAGYEHVIKSITANFDAEKFERICIQKKHLLQTYLYQVTNGDTKVATVDIGFNGTIQKNLELINDSGIWDYKHYIMFSREAIVAKLLEGINIDTFVNVKNRHNLLADIIRSVDVFEQVVIGLSGTTLDYKEQGGKVVPICDESMYTEQEIEARNSLKEGILFFFHIYIHLQKSHVFQKTNTHALAYMLHRLIRFPLPSEAKALMHLSYSTNFGNNSMYPLINPQQLQNHMGDFSWLDNVARGSYLSTGVCWPYGLWTLVDREFIVKNLPQDSQMGYVKKYIPKLLKVVEKERIAIYGAGEIGSQLIETLQILAKRPSFVIDRNKELHGSYLGNCKIISLEQAVSQQIEVIVIASMTFAAQIEHDIKQIYGESFHKLQIIRFDLT